MTRWQARRIRAGILLARSSEFHIDWWSLGDDELTIAAYSRERIRLIGRRPSPIGVFA